MSRGSGDADDRSAAATDQVGQRGLADGVGRAYVEVELGIEYADRSLVDSRTGGESADQVDDTEQGGAGVVGRDRQDILELLFVGEIGLDEVQIRMSTDRSSSPGATHGTTTRQPVSRRCAVTAAPRPPVPPLTSAVRVMATVLPSVVEVSRVDPVLSGAGLVTTLSYREMTFSKISLSGKRVSFARRSA